MKKNILILCTGNSCRSQMARGILTFLDEELHVVSAGTNPSKEVHPKAIEVMKELNIDISEAKPENVDKYIHESFDYVITVCDNAKETCPIFMGNVKKQLHIGFEDPAEAEGTEEEIFNFFRTIRDQIVVEFSKFYKQITEE